jgi:hypothetical protein
MNISQSVYERGSCPICLGPVAKVIEGDEPGQHEQWTVCIGGCGKRFAPPWLERHWGSPESRPIPPELAIVCTERRTDGGVLDRSRILVAYSEEGTPLAYCEENAQGLPAATEKTVDKTNREIIEPATHDYISREEKTAA